MSKGQYTQESEKYFIVFIAFLFLILSFIVIKDILTVIIFSFILAYFLFPTYNFYLKHFNNERISSLLSLITATTLIFIPFALLTYFLILSLIKILLQYRDYIQNPELLDATVSSFLEKFTNSQVLNSMNFSDYVSNVVILISDIARNFFSSIPKLIFYFLIMLFIAYYVLIYNKQILSSMNEYIPLNLRKQNEIIGNIKKNIKVLFKGYFLTGLIQTSVAVLGYIVFGAPNLMIISFLTLFVSLIPYLGTPLIWVPISLYMILVGNSVNGIGLLLYGTFIISMIDNFIRPILMSNKDTISPPLVFVGFIGGMLAFGIPGIILGPIIISITIILLKFLREHFEIKNS
jgi:predicted PurR-regulated permease PerM